MKRCISYLTAVLLLLSLLLPSLALPAAAEDAPAAVCAINGTPYSSLQEAVAAASSGDTIVVTANHTMDFTKGTTNSGGYYVLVNVANKSVTIDLGGCTVSVYGDAAHLSSISAADNMLLAVFCTDLGGNLTIKDTGGSGSVYVYANGANIYSVASTYGSGSALSIESGYYYLDQTSANAMFYAQKNTDFQVSGGSFYLGNTNSPYTPWIFNASGNYWDGGGLQITVTGGTYNADPTHSRGDVTLTNDTGYQAVRNADGTFSVFLVTFSDGTVREGSFDPGHMNDASRQYYFVLSPNGTVTIGGMEITLPQGGKVDYYGMITLPEGGSMIVNDRTLTFTDGASVIANPDGTVTVDNTAGATITVGDITVQAPKGSAVDTNTGALTLPDGDYTLPIGGENIPFPGGTVTPDGNGGYILVPSEETEFNIGGVSATVPGDGSLGIGADGSLTVSDGSSVTLPDGTEIVLPEGGTVNPDGTVTLPEGGSIVVDGKETSLPNGGTVSVGADGTITIEGETSLPMGGTNVTLPEGSTFDPDTGDILLPEDGGSISYGDSELELPGGSSIDPGTGTITLPGDSGSVSIGGTELELPPDSTLTPDGQGGFIVDPAGPNEDAPFAVGGNTTVELPENGTAILNPDGSVTVPDDSELTVGGAKVLLPEGGMILPDGSVTLPEGGSIVIGEAELVLPEGGNVTIGSDGKVTVKDETAIELGGTEITVPAGSAAEPEKGTVTLPQSGGTVTVGDASVTLPNSGTVSVTEDGSVSFAPTVSGTTAYGTVITEDADGNKVTYFLPNGCALTLGSDGTVTVSGTEGYLTDADGDGLPDIKMTDWTNHPNFPVYTLDSNTALSFTCSGFLDSLDRVEVSSVAVSYSKVLEAGTDYTAARGSTIISLQPRYLNRLAPAAYTVTLVYKDGQTVNTIFTVQAPAVDPDVPRTGDALLPTLAVMTVSLAALTTLLIVWKRTRRHES